MSSYCRTHLLTCVTSHTRKEPLFMLLASNLHANEIALPSALIERVVVTNQWGLNTTSVHRSSYQGSVDLETLAIERVLEQHDDAVSFTYASVAVYLHGIATPIVVSIEAHS